MTNSSFKLNIQESTQLKGIALLFLFCHHLFYVQYGLYDDIVIAGHGVVQEVGKVCVALFVFLSGYGLGSQYKDKEFDVWQFYKRRFSKLMPNYWMIWLLFVPIGTVFFGRTLSVAYPDHEYLRLAINLLGLQDFFGFYGFNPTWWFMSCIIGLYLLFPFIRKTVNGRTSLFLLLFAFLLLWSPVRQLQCITLYLFPFVAGICIACNTLNIKNLIGGGKYCLPILLIATVLWRQFGFVITGLKADPILAIEIVLFYKSLNITNKHITTALEFLGRHSMNIFLFHTFIFLYYCRDFVYATCNPFIIFTTLLATCLVISVVIEYIKKIAFSR